MRTLEEDKTATIKQEKSSMVFDLFDGFFQKNFVIQVSRCKSFN